MARKSARGSIEAVAGVDTIRGIAYQQMQAALMALDVLDSVSLTGLRVEGSDDVVDVEVFSAPGKVSRAAQIKTKTSRYAWSKGELQSVLRRWASLPDAESASFEFITDGRLGPSAESLSSALTSASQGDGARLSALVDEPAGSETLRRLSRAQVRLDPATVTALWLRAVRQVVAILPRVRTEQDSAEQAERRLGALVMLLTERASNANEAERIISRQEIAGTLGVDVDQSREQRWPGVLRERYVAFAQAVDADAPIQLDVATHEQQLVRQTTDEQPTSKPPLSVLDGDLPATLAGRTGTGKTTTVRALCRAAAAAGRVVLVAQAESYISGRLDALVADALSSVLKEDFPFATGRQIIADPTVTLVIDGVSEIPDSSRTGLAEELSRLVTLQSNMKIMLVGRDIASLRATLPTSVTSSDYVMVPLDYQRRRAVAKEVLRQASVAEEGMPASSPGDAEVHAVVTHLESVLGDAAGNPLLFRMGLSLYAEQDAFKNRAAMYDRFIVSMVARTGAIDISLATAMLSVVFSRLLDEGRRYADSFEWLLLIRAAAEAVGLPDPSALDAAAKRCGLIVKVGYTQTLAAMHDSFADYFAGWGTARNLSRLPDRLTQGDIQRILFSVEIGGLGCVGVDTIARDLPFLTVQLATHEEALPAETTTEAVAAILERLLPGNVTPGVLLAQSKSGKLLAALSDESSQWVSAAEMMERSRTLPVVAIDQGGPLTVATRLWRRFLQDKLTANTRFPVARPRSIDDACDALTVHATRTAEIVSKLMGEISPPGQQHVLTAQVGPLGLDAVIGPWIDDPMGGHWPVKYRRTAAISVIAAGVSDAATPAGLARRGGSASVEGMISQSPEEAAAKIVNDAIEELTVKRWLTH